MVPPDPARLLEALPAAVFLLDRMGSVRFATPQAADLVGHTPESIEGESILNFVAEHQAWSAAAALAMVTDYRGITTGPLRVSFIDGQGREHHADIWADNHLDDPDLEGLVCLLTPETVAVWLGQAVEAVARGADLSAVADHVVTAMRGHPVVADAALLVGSSPDSSMGQLGPSDVPSALVADDPSTPWRIAVQDRRRQIHATLDALPTHVASAASDAGYAAVWSEPIQTGCHDAAALVAWRRRPGMPSPNQITLLHQAGSILELAWRRPATRRPGDASAPTG